MKKTKFFALGLIALALASGLVLTALSAIGCSAETTNEEEEEKIEGRSGDFQYKVNGNTITITNYAIVPSRIPNLSTVYLYSF